MACLLRLLPPLVGFSLRVGLGLDDHIAWIYTASLVNSQVLAPGGPQMESSYVHVLRVNMTRRSWGNDLPEAGLHSSNEIEALCINFSQCPWFLSYIPEKERKKLEAASSPGFETQPSSGNPNCWQDWALKNRGFAGGTLRPWLKRWRNRHFCNP